MKKAVLFILLLVLFFWGCSKPRQHIYSTWYGTIDTDTMQSIEDVDGESFYIVNVEEVDSSISHAMNLEGAYFVDFFKPADSSYFRQMFGNDGGESDRIYYNPYKDR